jgi:hypothetical protein
MIVTAAEPHYLTNDVACKTTNSNGACKNCKAAAKVLGWPSSPLLTSMSGQAM